LVGIAGEDDLDAPDLIAPTTPSARTESSFGKIKDRLNGGQEQLAHNRSAKVTSSPPKPILEPEESAALREHLTAELNGLNDAEDTTNWTHRVLNTKDTLSPADAECVEKALQARLATIESDTKEPNTRQFRTRSSQPL
jgi:hypothetical protein